MRKMDEMETKIALESIRWCWFFTVVALFLWSVLDIVKTGKATLPCYLLAFQNLIYFFATQIGKWKAGDERGRKAIVWYLPLFVVFLLGFGFVLFTVK
ncbi:MAG: hypothetical protein LKJ17_03935 [Oscillospiraceae bacterium]|jgi:hypothetical protein|nr:hypothetical protein [Oscillospiraceae bacterium]